MKSYRSLLLLAALLTGGCQTSTEPSTALLASRKSSSTLTPSFLHPAPGAPSIANDSVGFWARSGESRIATMWYHAQPGTSDSTMFLRFKVGAKSLLSRPDGSLIARGDSVFIIVRLVDRVSLVVDFQPAGLRFNPNNPAELRMSYAETDPDVNGDGVVDQNDVTLTRRFQIWRQEDTASPWLSQTSTIDLLEHDVETTVFGFTRYAIAY